MNSTEIALHGFALMRYNGISHLFLSMPERNHHHPSQEAQDTLRAVKQHFRWRSPVEPFRYAPSSEQVLPDEAATEAARRNAQGFVLGLVHAVTPLDDQAPQLLTPDEVKARYELHMAAASEDDVDAPRFSLREAWASAERMRRHVREVARATDDWNRLAIARQLHRVAILIEDALPPEERPPLF